jgi:hypothetical protein
MVNNEVGIMPLFVFWKTIAAIYRGSNMVKFSISTGKLVAVGFLAVTLQGCVPTIVMNSMDHQHYSDYVTQTDQLNFQREKAGLKPVPIMTFDQWKG